MSRKRHRAAEAGAPSPPVRVPQPAAAGAPSPGRGAQPADPTPHPASRIPRCEIAALAGLAAAWLAAGSTGLLAHGLRHALTWLALGAAAIAAWPGRGLPWPRVGAIAAGVAGALLLTASSLPPVNVFAVVVLLAALAASHDGLARRQLALAAFAAAVLGLYRLVLTSVPALWLAAEALGEALGRLAGRISGRALWVGATFAGLDYLVLMAAFCGGWLALTAPPRLPRALRAAVAILVGHLAYLVTLSFGADLAAAIPEPPPAPAFYNPNEPHVWTWAEGLRTLLPWNLPALAAAAHLAIAGFMLRWAPWEEGGLRIADCGLKSAIGARKPAIAVAALGLLALALPAVTTLGWSARSLAGKKVVAYEKGFLNWLKPKHGEYGRLSVGMYGMLPEYLASLGAECVISPELSEQDLAGASLVILFFPNEPWKEGQLERLWDFARRGGSLLVCGEHTIREKDGGSHFNEVLAPTAMRVRYDSATFAVGGWLQSYEALAHPTNAGVGDARNEFGCVIGASVRVRWPARPLLVGRWGWADPGDPAGPAQMGNHRYDAGERLGDVVLAAEQPFGRGRIVAFGDTSGFTNGITAGSHVYTSRLYAYLAGGGVSPQATWRQAVGLLAALGLLALLAWRPAPGRVALAAAALALSLVACTAISHRAGECLPDGRAKTPNNLAYIDSSHIGASSDEQWRSDGLMGLTMTLMRNGYLALHLPELSAARLERAGLLVSVAPRKAFTRAERRVVRQWVEGGGIFISTVGWGDHGPSRALLADFGFHVGGARAASGREADEPRPLGHFKAPYVNLGDYMAHVRFHAAWPIEYVERDARPIAYGPHDTTVVAMRKVGQGKVVVVGDTCFAMNKNLEHEGGEPFEGMRENADFWRWLLADLAGQPRWLPPRPAPPPAPAPAPSAGGTP